MQWPASLCMMPAKSHIDEAWQPTCQLQECGIGLRGTGTRNESLAGAWGPVQQHTLGRPDAQGLEAVCMSHRQYHSFHQLLDLLVQATHIAVIFCWLLIHLHADMADQKEHADRGEDRDSVTGPYQ